MNAQSSGSIMTAMSPLENSLQIIMTILEAEMIADLRATKMNGLHHKTSDALVSPVALTSQNSPRISWKSVASNFNDPLPIAYSLGAMSHLLKFRIGIIDRFAQPLVRQRHQAFISPTSDFSRSKPNFAKGQFLFKAPGKVLLLGEDSSRFMHSSM
ncbi:hypothetical protein ACLOJK_006215 [Asimina triloba]